MTLRVRDFGRGWMCEFVGRYDVRYRHGDAQAIEAVHMARALAVAIPALQEMEGPCGNCGGEVGWELGDGSWWECPDCDGTGANAARRALNTVIGEGE